MQVPLGTKEGRVGPWVLSIPHPLFYIPTRKINLNFPGIGDFHFSGLKPLFQNRVKLRKFYSLRIQVVKLVQWLSLGVSVSWAEWVLNKCP